MTPLLPEVSADGLVLWRLRRSSDEQFWCSVTDAQGELVLTVHNPSCSGIAVREKHPDVSSLLERAERVSATFRAAGWRVVDVDVDEPD